MAKEGRQEAKTESINLADSKSKEVYANEHHRYLDDKVAELHHTKLILEVVIGVLIAAVFVLLAIVIYLLTVKPYTSITYCDYKDSDYVKPRDFHDPEPFDDLTPEEYNSVLEFMLGDKELGLTPFDKASPGDNYILLVDLFLPPKKEVLEYSDKGGKKPMRKAFATVVRGGDNLPKLEEYVISPLPEPTSARVYRNPSYRRHPIPYLSRPNDYVYYVPLFRNVISPAAEKLSPLLVESYGRSFGNCTSKDDCIVFYDTGPDGTRSGEKKVWVRAMADHNGGWMHPLGLEMLINANATDTGQWRIEMIVYNGQNFDSVDHLLKAYLDKSLKMVDMRDEDLSFSDYGIKKHVPDLPTQGPRLFEPDGKRFLVEGQHVTYGEWSFYFHMSPTIGLKVFDAKFHGLRVAYEISLQEVLVLYTGYGPSQSVSDFYDGSWFFGTIEFELARGVDCPETAVFLDTYFLANSGSVKRTKNNVCIFETKGEVPTRRHYDDDYGGGYNFYGGLPDYHLVIRAVATSGNYDYVLDYIFYPSGVIEVKASATGYVFTTFRLLEEEQYGGIIQDKVMANLHSHLFNFKIDLDVYGEQNRYMSLDIGLETIQNPWLDNANITQMKITKNIVGKESKSGPYKHDVPQYHIIYSNTSKNEFGSYRGYRILNKSPIPFIEKSLPVTRAANWAKYPIMVTRRKDDEQASSTIFAQNEPYDPVLDFDDFINDESLLDEDLVAWVTTGTYHVPGTEDIPSTPTTWNQYSIFVAPHNYFEECPSVSSPDNVLIQKSDGHSSKSIVPTFAHSPETKCTPTKTGPTDFDGMRHTVRKK